MKVYVLWNDNGFNSYVVGVFSTRAGAQVEQAKHIERYQQMRKGYLGNMLEIKEEEVRD